LNFQDDIILQLRRKIANSYFIMGWLAGLSYLLFLGLRIFLGDNPVLKSIFESLYVVAFIKLITIYSHRSKLLALLNPADVDAVSRYEDYISNRQNKWSALLKYRYWSGALLGIAMILSLIISKESRWTMFFMSISLLFFSFILLNSWMMYQDRIWLQQLKNKLSYQAPDIST